MPAWYVWILSWVSVCKQCNDQQMPLFQPCSFGWRLMVGAGSFREKHTAGRLLVAGLFREESTAGWRLISQANSAAAACVMNSRQFFRIVAHEMK
jgi:hypothetical protein